MEEFYEILRLTSDSEDAAVILINSNNLRYNIVGSSLEKF